MFYTEKLTCALTLAHCDEILKKIHGISDTAKSVGMKVSPLSETITGFMGKHLILRIRYMDSEIKERTFFVKSVTDLDNPCVEYFSDVHNKETGMYAFIDKFNNEFGQLLRVESAPKLYFNHVASKTMVLEDLSVRDFKMPATKTVDKDHMLVSIKALAKFHAASFIYEEDRSEKLGRKFVLPEEYEEYLIESVFSRNCTNGYNYVMAAARGLCSLTHKLDTDNRISVDEFKRQTMTAVDKLLDLIADRATYRCVWNHGDLWARNMLYSYSKDGRPVECQFVDFQLARYTPPSLDLTMLINHTLDDATFQAEYQSFLECYYDSLDDALKLANLEIARILPKCIFLESCAVYLHCAKTIKVIYRTMSASSDEAYKKLCCDLVKFKRVNFEDRTEYVLENFENDPNYRTHLTEIMEVFKNMILEESYKE